MSDKIKNVISAQVILKPEGGKAPLSPEKITSENVRQMMPSAKDLQTSRRYFAELGFEVDAGFANNFSITGDAKLFEKTFKSKFTVSEKQGVKVIGKDEQESSELPTENLAGEVKKSIDTITFSEPPDFGPGNF